MKKTLLKNIRAILIAIVVIALFIFFSWLSNNYAEELAGSAFSFNVYGELLYFLISVVSVVMAGLSASPLIPLANVLWGPTITIVLTASGWTLGSMIAFWLSRRFGKKLVCRLVNMCDFDDYKKGFKPKSLFWQVLLARIFLPVDILSYLIGLFTKMSGIAFFFATLIGSAVFTLLAIFASGLSIEIQVIIGGIIIFIFFYKINGIIKKTMLK